MKQLQANRPLSRQMNRPAYCEISDLWEVEGSLRDIYVLHSDLAGWRAFMAFAAGYPCSYSFDGETGVLPEVSQLLANLDGSHLLSIDIGGVTANCHFFMESEIELDVDPREAQNADAHDAVFSFVEGMARAIGGPVLLTPENGSDVPFLSYEPASGEWHAHS